MLIGSILKGKGSAVIAVAPEASVLAVARTLSEHRIGAALVRAAQGELLGIISERDIVRGMAAHGPGTTGLQASQLMTRDIITVTPATLVAEALEVMTRRRIRHLPVLAAGRLVGMVSIGDLVKARIEEAEHEAAALKDYVTAG